ncbi:MAG: DedA family protein [Gemmatimonadaceae bacterium]|nr:DedA family protein [Gemmatimonadaceae bacterium]
MDGTIGHLIGTYGYGILFLLTAVESLGIPLPGETALVTAAAFAANGKLDVAWVFGVGVAAALIGDNSGYWLGRTGGLPLVERYGHHIGLNASKLAKVRGFYERHGSKTVLIGRFIAILRSWAAVLAGVMRMSYPRFVAFNTAGCVVWTAVFTTVGYLFGKNLPLVEKYIREVGIAVAALIVIAIVVFCIRKRSRAP